MRRLNNKKKLSEIQESRITKKVPGYGLITGKVLKKKIPEKALLNLPHMIINVLRLKHVS